MAELRTISRILEFYHLPIQHSPDTLRDIYLEVSRSCDFDNFIRIAGGARLESAAEDGAASSGVTFMKDRISFREERASGSLEHFLRRIEATVSVATERLGIPLFVARNITFRAVTPPPATAHAVQFLTQNVFQLQEHHFAGFERPGQLLGFRMQFPPKDPTREALHQVRIECFLPDPRSMFVEDWATYKMPLPSKDWARLAEEAREVELFLQERLGGFLDQFGALA